MSYRFVDVTSNVENKQSQTLGDNIIQGEEKTTKYNRQQWRINNQVKQLIIPQVKDK